MKKYLIIFIALLPRFSHAQIYVSKTGSDATGDGSNVNPYESIYKAANVSTSGDTIYVAAGIYNESRLITLPPVINIKGAGRNNTTLNSTADNMMLLSSTPGTNGNQDISGITFTGTDLTSNKAIKVYGRSNVSIHDCNFKNFKSYAVLFDGGNLIADENASNGNFATGNKFYNDSVINCNQRIGTGADLAQIIIMGQDGIEIHDGYYNQTQRADGYNGNILSGVNGYIKNIKYYNNTSVKTNSTLPFTYGGDSSWNFHIETWYGLGGNQIYNNKFLGGGVAIDVSGTYNIKGSAPYAWKIKGNEFSMDAQNGSIDQRTSQGVHFETRLEKSIIDSNKFVNLQSGIFVTGLSIDVNADSVYITRNIFENIGNDPQNEPSFNILLGVDDNDTINHCFIDNNTFLTKSGNSNTSYTLLMRANATGSQKGSLSNINFRNNIVYNNSSVGYLAFWEWTGNYTNIISDNNIVYGNGNSNNYYKRSTNTVGITETGSIKSNPLLDADFIPQTGSPAIDAAIDLGYGTSIGAVQIADVVAPPTVTTSGDQTLITNSTTIFSTPVAASGQTISSILWTDITGSGSATITSPTTQNTGITGLSVGTHTFRVEVTQSDGQKAHADVSITLNAAPTANAGTDQTITLPTTSTTLSGSATVASGQTATYLWTKVSGAGTQTITNNTTLNPTVTGMTTAGDYVYQLKVTQTDTQFATSTVTVHVNAATAPQTPVINLRKPTIVIQIH